MKDSGYIKRLNEMNDLIKVISSVGRRFFYHDGEVSYFFIKNNRLYMKNEYNGLEMCLSTKYGYPPRRFHHGGTLWALVTEFKEYIRYGINEREVSVLYSPYWGYDKSDMEVIRNYAIGIKYLKDEK